MKTQIYIKHRKYLDLLIIGVLVISIFTPPSTREDFGAKSKSQKLSATIISNYLPAIFTEKNKRQNEILSLKNCLQLIIGTPYVHVVKAHYDLSEINNKPPLAYRLIYTLATTSWL
jgi:hypothetical protein